MDKCHPARLVFTASRFGCGVWNSSPQKVIFPHPLSCLTTLMNATGQASPYRELSYKHSHASHHPTSSMILPLAKQQNCLPRGVRSFLQACRTCGAGGGRADQFALVPFPPHGPHQGRHGSTGHHVSSAGNTGQAPGRQSLKHPSGVLPAEPSSTQQGSLVFMLLRSSLQSCRPSCLEVWGCFQKQLHFDSGKHISS